ncbi:MAG: TauD/TfdA family dioxygenase [Sphingomonas sp.]|nr:TauD/TfdA family dioxygenase [Sphingomonas sp.]
MSTYVRGNHPAATILKVDVGPERRLDAVAAILDEALRQARVVHVSGGPPAPEALDFWAAVNMKLGDVDYRGENPMTLERIPAIWNDIRYDPALATTYRHSKTAQPLHTDGAYNANPPTIGFFFCEAQARHGGRTLFLDGDCLCETLQRESRELYADLRSIPIAFRKGEASGQIVPVIGRDKYGPVINWNYYRISPGQSAEIDRLKNAFFAYLESRFVQTESVAPLHLAPGDCMVFHDLRVLHGREAYEAEKAGERCLWNLNVHWRGEAVVRSSSAS